MTWTLIHGRIGMPRTAAARQPAESKARPHSSARRPLKPSEPPPPYVSRKARRKKAEREHSRPCHWVGGRLYFRDAQEEEVPNVPHMPKPGREATGWAAGFPPRGVRDSGRDFDAGAWQAARDDRDDDARDHWRRRF